MTDRLHYEVSQTSHRMRPPSSRSGSLKVTALALLVFLGGCARAKPVHYYQISYASSSLGSGDALDVTLLIRNLMASHLYREDRIVFGSSSEQMGTYTNERWAEAPTDMLQNALIRGLRAGGRFRSVMPLRSDFQGDFIITGHLYDFKEMEANGVQARLNFDLEMRDAKSRKLVWTHSYNHDEPASGKGITAVAAAMNKNVQRSVQEVQGSLEEYFRSHPAK